MWRNPSDPSILRRLGLSPKERCVEGMTCPDIFELADGRFAIMGADMTDELEPMLPADAGRAEYERIVVITRETLVAARNDIPVA
jgi:hypothetical protein